MDSIAVSNGHSHDSETQRALSRRSFVSVAVGAFAALPAALGGFCLPVFSDEAYAAEGTSAGPSAKIVIAKANQSGFVVVDLANNGRKPVANANVTITSSSNGKTVSGTTDREGLFLADITQLADKDTDENGLETYSFYGTFEVAAPGYRVYRTGRVSVKGAKGYEVPTRSLGTDRTYPSMVSFDDWDVLYTNNEFAITEANDTKHTLSVEIRSATNAPLVVHLKDASGRVIASQQGAPEAGVCKVDISRFFLLATHADVLSAGSGFSVSYSFEGNEYRVPLRLSTVNSPTGVSAPGTGKISLSPFGTPLMKLQVTFPDWVPLLRRQKVEIWKPDVNLDIAFDPFGYFRVAYKSDEYGYKSKNGKYEGEAWKMHPRSTYAEGYSKAVKERIDVAKKSVPKIKNWKSFDFEPERSLSATIGFEAGLAGRWNADSALWRAMLEFKATLGFNFSYAMQMFLGPVPVIVEFGFATSLSVGLSMGVATPEIFSISKYRFDYTNTGIGYTIAIAPTLSIGVGVKGVASVSLQGMLAFTFFVNVGPVPEGAPTDSPHLIVGLKAILNVVIQFFLFAMPIKWCGYDNPTFYDNWNVNRGLSTSADEAVYPPDSSSFAWFMEEGNQPQPLPLEAFDPLVEMSGEIDMESQQALSPMADERQTQGEAVVTEHTTMEGLSYRTLEWVTASDEAQADNAQVGADGAKSTHLRSRSTSSEKEKPQLRLSLMAEPGLPNVLNVDSYAVVEAKVPRYWGNAMEADLLGSPRIANESGLVPGVRVKIASSVLSDPRAKVVSLYGIPYLFRIAAVTINRQVRTRVIGQRILSGSESMGKPIVFDFWPGPDRASRGRDKGRIDLWDYDFDVCTVSYPEYNFIDLNFFVISGKRPNGMKTSLGEAVANQAFSFVRFRVEKNGYITVNAQSRWANDMQFEKDPAYPYHCYSCPHIEHVSDYYKLDPSDPLGYAKSNTFIMTFLDRAMKSPDKALSDKLEDVKPNIGMIMQYEAVTGYNYDMTAFDLHGLVDKANLDDASIYQMTCNKRITADRTCGWSHITLQGGNASYHFLICTATHMDAELDGNGRISRIIPGIKYMEFWDKCTNEQFLEEDSVGKARHLVDWPGHDGMFLAAADGKLKSARIVGFDAGAPRVVYEDIGPENFNISGFGIDPTGTILYYPATRSGSPGFAYDASKAASGKVSSTDLPEVKEHRIMASRLRNGKFCDPFVFAEVDYAVDSLDVVSVSNSTIGFVSSDIVDPEKGRADMYFTAIPFINCLTVIGCEVLSPFAFPGSSVVLNVTVRNDGNTFATGFTAQLHLKGSTVVESTARVMFGADTIVPSIYNPADASGALENVEEGYVLAPGKSSVYKVVVAIPDSWRGEKEVCVSAAEIKIVGEGMAVRARGMEPMADSDGEGDTQIIDGDYLATYELDDSQALEYVAGSSKEDYGEDGAPFDMLALLGENHLFDEDDYDDYLSEYDDYHMQLFDAPVALADDDVTPSVAHGPSGGGTPDGGDDSPGDGSGSGAKSVPKAGDALGPLGGFAVAAVAAGAAFTAYSARRTRIEREELAGSQDALDERE